MTVARRPAARRLGRYVVGEQIGSGGIGDVFAATTEGHDGFRKEVVIKVLRRELADAPELASALRDEANVARRLSHGNIVQVLDLGDEEGRPYLVLEHVDGASLQELVDHLEARGERLPLPTALHVVDEIAVALDHAHRFTDDSGVPAPVIHRDVKPGNVLVSKSGVVKLTDFGIAKAAGRRLDTLAGTVKGTPLYLAPEQAAGGIVDARSDVFGLGRVLQRLVLGPPGSPRPRATEDIDDELRAIVTRALADDPAARTPDIDTLRADLHAHCVRGGIRPTAGPLGDLVRQVKGARPRRRQVALDAALAGDSPRHATVHAVPTRASAPPRRAWILGAVLAVMGLVAAVWGIASPRVDASSSPSTSAERAEPRAHPSDEAGEASTQAAPDPPKDASAQASSAQELAAVEPVPARPTEDPSGVAGSPPPEPGPSRSPPARQAKATLRVNVMPYADVSLDGVSLGRTPVDRRVTSGTGRKLVLEHPTIGKTVREIDLPPGGEVSIQSW